MSEILLTPLQTHIIDYIIAAQEDSPLQKELEDYILAFDGVFDPSRDFTLHAPTANDIALYYNIAGARNRLKWMEKAEFSTLCRSAGSTLIAIADFCLYLAENGYAKGEYLERKRWELPVAEQKNWRRYQDFNSAEKASLLNYRTMRITPRLKLYRLWESLRTGKAAGE